MAAGVGVVDIEAVVLRESFEKVAEGIGHGIAKQAGDLHFVGLPVLVGVPGIAFPSLVNSR